MAISPVFDVLAQRLDYLKQRQAVIGMNVANANSPGYQAQDLESFTKVLESQTKSKGVQGGPMTIALTNANHIAPSGARVGGDYAYKRDKNTYEVLPGGNSVVIEEQMVKIAEVQADFQLATNLYKKMHMMVKTAIGKGA